MVRTVPVKLGDRSYSIHVGNELLDRSGAMLRECSKGALAFLVTDSKVGPIYAQQVEKALESSGFRVRASVVPAGESAKCLKVASQLLDDLVTFKADRRTLVVALGGGVVGDLAGFVAATYARGIPFAQVPTTLLAMVDASVGGKVAVDHPRAKNMIGAFHQPIAVLCDLDCLATLPDREFRSGLAEVVKYGVILDAEFFQFLETRADDIARRSTGVIGEIVARCCELKADVVERDEHETLGLRAALNYGHTFAHAFETACGYELLQHGEAVAIGMIRAGELACRLGRVGADFNQRQRELWRRLQLPTEVPGELRRRDLVDIMRNDKKSQAGKLRFVLPSRIGSVELVDGIDEDLVREVL